jgi:hypothetical protein
VNAETIATDVIEKDNRHLNVGLDSTGAVRTCVDTVSNVQLLKKILYRELIMIVFYTYYSI